MERGTISRLLDYYFDKPKFQKDIKRAFEEFFDIEDLELSDMIEAGEREKALFHEWFVYDFQLSDDKTPLEDFYERNPYNWKQERIKPYKDLQKNEYGLWEILEVRRGEGLKLKNVSTGHVFEVREYTGTFQVSGGEFFFNRIATVADHYEMVGADNFLLPKEAAREFTSPRAKKHWSRMDLNPKIVRDLFLTVGFPLDTPI